MPDRASMRRLRAVAVFVLAACALAIACGGSSSQPRLSPPETVAPVEAAIQTPATATPAALPTPRPSPPSARPFSPEVLQRVQPLLDRAVELRGAPPKSEVAMFLIGRREAIDDYRDSFDKEDLAFFELQEKVYKLLAMIPATTDLRESFLSLLGGGILGFYDPERKAFYLVDDVGGTDSLISRTTLVHEFSHALQDQYYDINKLGKARKADWDAQTAFLDVVEGDAVATETSYSGTNLHGSACNTIPPVLGGGLPYVVRRNLNTWYTDGNCFVLAALARASRDDLFARLPSTTEQILHPDKYFGGEGAKPVTLTSLATALGAGWKQAGQSNLGEYTLQNLLVLGLRDDRPQVQRATAGWGGDAWALYEKDGARLIEVSTVWDSVEDAQEFFASLTTSLTNRSAKARPKPEGSLDLTLDDNTWRVSLTNDRVDLVVSPDADAVERAANALGMR